MARWKNICCPLKQPLPPAWLQPSSASPFSWCKLLVSSKAWQVHTRTSHQQLSKPFPDTQAAHKEKLCQLSNSGPYSERSLTGANIKHNNQVRQEHTRLRKLRLLEVAFPCMFSDNHWNEQLLLICHSKYKRNQQSVYSLVCSVSSIQNCHPWLTIFSSLFNVSPVYPWRWLGPGFHLTFTYIKIQEI